MKLLQALFGPRVETRFVSTISIIVGIALVSLMVVASAEQQRLNRAALEEQVQLVARVAQGAYPEPGLEPSWLPRQVLQVTTSGPEGARHTLAPGRGNALPVARVPPGPEGTRVLVPGGLELLVFTLPGPGDRVTRVACDARALDWQNVLLAGQMVLVGSAILISCYFLGVFLARILLGPLERFTEATRRVGAGNLDPVQVPEAPADFGPFQDAFNVMLQQIRQAQEMERAMLAQDKMATVGRLAAAVAHETRNPLAAISSLTQMVADEVREDPRLREYTRVVLKEVARLDVNITHLLEYARPVRPSMAESRVDRLLRDVVVLLGFEARRLGVRLEVEGPAGDPGTVPPRPGEPGEAEQAGAGEAEAGEAEAGEAGAGEAEAGEAGAAPGGPGGEGSARPAELSPLGWMVDGDQLKQVLVNLVKNALGASEIGGRVRVAAALEPGGEALRLEVEDEGPGVPPARREEIFEPFVSETQGGTGLGLAVARRIVEQHCGKLWVEEGAGGRGARFVVRLPRLEAPPAAPAPAPARGPSPWPQRD